GREARKDGEGREDGEAGEAGQGRATGALTVTEQGGTRVMRYACMAISAIVLLTYISTAAAEENEPLWSLSTSVNASIGDYGTGKDTTLVYVPFTLGVKPLDGFTLGLTVPYIYQTGQTIVITGGGVAVRKDKQRQLNTATRNQVTSTEQGLGDVL